MRTTITQIGPGTASVGPVVLTATLVDAVASSPVVGRTLIFNLGSQNTAAPTNASGVASALLNLAQAPATVPLVVTFPGDESYAATQASRPFQIVVDTDRDGLPDSWEINGADTNGDGAIDLNLPAMGAHPLRKDLFVEVDWMVKPSACVWLVCWTNGGVLQPQRAVLDELIARFATAPVGNPDGSIGITLHVDGGPNTVMNPATGEPWGPSPAPASCPTTRRSARSMALAITTGPNSTPSRRYSSSQRDVPSFTTRSTPTPWLSCRSVVSRVAFPPPTSSWPQVIRHGMAG